MYLKLQFFMIAYFCYSRMNENSLIFDYNQYQAFLYHGNGYTFMKFATIPHSRFFIRIVSNITKKNYKDLGVRANLILIVFNY